MANKDSRSGGKFSGNHTTLSPLAAKVCDIAHKCAHVTTISPGFLKAGLPPVNGKRRVKITSKSGGVLLSIRDNTSNQEVHLYTSDLQATKMLIARECRNLGISIAFNQN